MFYTLANHLFTTRESRQVWISYGCANIVIEKITKNHRLAIKSKKDEQAMALFKGRIFYKHQMPDDDWAAFHSFLSYDEQKYILMKMKFIKKYFTQTNASWCEETGLIKQQTHQSARLYRKKKCTFNLISNVATLDTVQCTLFRKEHLAHDLSWDKYIINHLKVSHCVIIMHHLSKLKGIYAWHKQ